MHLFYADHIEGEKAFLGKEESHHATRVLRLNIGNDILLTLGEGAVFRGTIRTLNKNQSEVDITGIYSSSERKRYLHIAICPTKSLDRFEFFLEKATEVGIDEITPLISFHSERKVYKTERGRKVIMAAAKQSISNWLPKLNEPQSFSDFVKQQKDTALFIAHCDESQQRHSLSSLAEKFLNKCTVMIGPEGDFSPQEIEQAISAGSKALDLGEKRLRTETAGMVVSVFHKLGC